MEIAACFRWALAAPSPEQPSSPPSADFQWSGGNPARRWPGLCQMFGIPANQSAGDEWEAFADWEAFMESRGGDADCQPITQSKVKSFLEGKGLSSSS